MHELSVALEVCRMAEDRLGPTELSRLTAVGLEIGENAGVEPSNLEFCLDSLLSAPPFTGARAVITRLPGDALRLVYLEVDDGGPND